MSDHIGYRKKYPPYHLCKELGKLKFTMKFRGRTTAESLSFCAYRTVRKLGHDLLIACMILFFSMHFSHQSYNCKSLKTLETVTLHNAAFSAQGIYPTTKNQLISLILGCVLFWFCPNVFLEVQSRRTKSSANRMKRKGNSFYIFLYPL